MNSGYSRFDLGIILTAVFLNFVSYGIIIPFLPLYAEKFGVGGFGIGLLFASYAIAQFIFTPIMGRLSDEWGRRPVLIVSLLGEGFYLIALIFSFSFWWLLGVRVIGGVFGSFTGVAQAYLSDITASESRTRAMGYFGAAFSAGFIAGPIVGSYFSTFSINLPGCLFIKGYELCLPQHIIADASIFAVPFLVAGIINLFAGALAYFFLKESLAVSSLPAFFQGFSYVFSQKPILFLMGFYFLGIFAFSNLETIFSIYSQNQIGLSPQSIGYLFGLAGFLAAFSQIILLPLLSRFMKDAAILALGGFILALGLILLAISPNIPFYVFAISITIGFGVGLSSPAVLSLLSKIASEENYGIVLGTNQSLARLSQVLGSMFAGFGFQYITPNSPFLIAGLIMFFAFFVFIFRFYRDFQKI